MYITRTPLLQAMWPGIKKKNFKYAFWSSAKEEQAFYFDKLFFFN